MEEGTYRDGQHSANPEFGTGRGGNRGRAGGRPIRFAGPGRCRLQIWNLGPRGRGAGRARGGWLGRGGRRGGKRGELLRNVCPQDLRFTQDSIRINFQPPHEDHSIDDAVQKIREKDLSPAQFPPLNVVEHNGILWSLDNRRLWVFRQAGVEEISANLVPKNFSPRSTEFFNNLNADLEERYSNPTYYPRVRGRLGSKSSADHFNDVEITGAGATLPSLATRLPQKKDLRKYTASELISIRYDAAMEGSLYLPLPGFDKEGEWSKFRNMYDPVLVNSTDITDAGATLPSFESSLSQEKNVLKYTASELISIRDDVAKEGSSYLPLPGFDKEGECSKSRNMSDPVLVQSSENTGPVNASFLPKLSPEPKVMPSVNVVPNPEIHHHVIDIRNPVVYVRVPNLEEGANSEDGETFVKKLLNILRFVTGKASAFLYEFYIFLRGMFRER